MDLIIFVWAFYGLNYIFQGPRRDLAKSLLGTGLRGLKSDEKKSENLKSGKITYRIPFKSPETFSLQLEDIPVRNLLLNRSIH